MCTASHDPAGKPQGTLRRAKRPRKRRSRLTGKALKGNEKQHRRDKDRKTPDLFQVEKHARRGI